MHMRKEKRAVPLIFYFSLAFFFIGVFLSILYRRSAVFAGFINQSVAYAFRLVLGSITSIVPFSAAEMLLFSIPLWVILAVVLSVRYADTGRRRIRFFLIILSLLLPLYPLYMLTLAPGYHAPTLEEQMHLSTENIEKEEIVQTAEHLLSELEQVLDRITFDERGASENPLSLKETGDGIIKAYDDFLSDYKIAHNFYARPKTVILREWMTYAGITGMYTFFTGEANVNTTYPDYNHPFTVAHELAHQRGIARENEANFVAALVCIYSENDYIRYSGLFNLLEYILSAYYRADPDSYTDFYKSLDPRIKGELKAYREFAEPYQDHVLGEVSTTVNNAYLEMNGTPGIISYGLVVELAVAHFSRG